MNGVKIIFICSKERILHRNHYDFTIYVAKTKALISCTVFRQLICPFVFHIAYIRFSHYIMHLLLFEYIDMHLKKTGIA